mgnify:CR=1 FL=1|tara:strand:- start:1452 stop:2378 length:927 start_codon:yes stop_codon:yes gene_type:complete
MGAKDVIMDFASPSEIGTSDRIIKDAELKEVSLMPSTIETIDMAMFDWLNESLNVSSMTNKGWEKVPVIWVASERAKQIKDNKSLRDSNGALKLPILTLMRDGISKDSNFKGVAWAHIPQINDPKGGALVVARKINHQKTANFKNAFAKRHHGQYNFPSNKNLTVYNTYSVPMPTYVAVTYTVSIRAEYQQQINDILTPFVTKTGQINNFFITKDGHKFEGFIQGDFSQMDNSSNLGSDERSYETSVSIRVLGHLLGDGPNAERPKMAVRENAVQIVQVRERAALKDEPSHIDAAINTGHSKDGFYKE